MPIANDHSVPHSVWQPCSVAVAHKSQLFFAPPILIFVLFLVPVAFLFIWAVAGGYTLRLGPSLHMNFRKFENHH